MTGQRSQRLAIIADASTSADGVAFSQVGVGVAGVEVATSASFGCSAEVDSEPLPVASDSSRS